MKVSFTGNSSGFTLVEVMVVIAIIGIMSGIAIPNFIGWLPDYRLRSATRDIVSSMQAAKMRAVKENANVGIECKQNSDYTIFLDTVVGAPFKFDLADTIISQVTLPAGVDIQNDYTVGFNSRGLLESVAGTVQIQNTKLNTSSVIVNVAGNIRVQ